MDRLLNLFFHPWEFLDLTGYRVPGLVRQCDGRPMLKRVERQLHWLKREARFIRFSDFERYLPRDGQAAVGSADGANQDAPASSDPSLG